MSEKQEIKEANILAQEIRVRNRLIKDPDAVWSSIGPEASFDLKCVTRIKTNWWSDNEKILCWLKADLNLLVKRMVLRERALSEPTVVLPSGHIYCATVCESNIEHFRIEIKHTEEKITELEKEGVISA